MDSSTPLPWSAYVGGNFIRLGGEAFDEYVKETNYMGGPHSVASIQCNATEHHEYDMRKAIANTAVLLIGVNCYPILRDALSRIAAAGDKEACRIAREALMSTSYQVTDIKKHLDRELKGLIESGLVHAA